MSGEALWSVEAEMFRALGDATRLRILWALAPGPLSVGDLGERIGAPQPTVSRHLKVLRDQSLVSASREGRFVRYRLSDEDVLGMLTLLRRVLIRSLEWSRGGLDGALSRAPIASDEERAPWPTPAAGPADEPAPATVAVSDR
jgi:DNA-binding transcriptional ArsR family regulator